MSSPLEVPHHSYEELRKHADNFLRTYNPKGTIPVSIEEIVEFEFGINIVPIPGLHQGFEIDGFISSDLTVISVDQFVNESRRVDTVLPWPMSLDMPYSIAACMSKLKSHRSKNGNGSLRR